MATDERGTAVEEEGLSLTGAVNLHLASVPPNERQDTQAELLRFARWYGADRRLQDLVGHDVASYVETIGAAAPDTPRRLEILRSFFTVAKKKKWLGANLAPHVRLRKTTRSEKSTAALPTQEIKLTPEGHASLKEELQTLIDQRPQIAAELQKAMADKDFRENAPLDAMREHQAHHEARIRELQAILKQAVVVDAVSNNSNPRAGVGSTVVLRNLSTGSTARYTLVGPNEVNTAQGRISVLSPVGKAVIDRFAGDEVDVQAPAGAMRFLIEAIET
jgi:transcription elongation factor GreA